MEGFFQVSSSFDYEEVIDVLLLDKINLELLEVEDLPTVIERAIEKTERSKWWIVWSIQLPHMQRYVSFDDFYDDVTGKNIDVRPTEEVEAELDAIEERFEE